MTYTNEQINEAIKAALAEKGEDYVYERVGEGAKQGCYYAVDGAPSCLVGNVLNRLDPEMFAQVIEYETDTPEYQDTGFEDVAEYLRLPFHEDQVAALKDAQVKQDQGKTWGEAAQKYAEKLGETL